MTDKVTDQVTEQPPKSRDRARTEEAIVAAARQVLADTGFQGFGINAIARQAGCDKQLIYRYYGGLDGLAEAIGNDVAGGLGRQLSDQMRGLPASSYADLIERLVLGFIEVLRADPLLQRVVAWEISEPTPMVLRFAAARAFVLRRWVERERGTLAPPDGVDVAALNAVLIAAAQQLVLQASATGGFAGITLDDPGWARIRATIRRIVRAAYRVDADPSTEPLSI